MIATTAREDEIVQCRLDILDAYAELGKVMSTPAINDLGAARRRHAIQGWMSEIARMERNLSELRQEGTA